MPIPTTLSNESSSLSADQTTLVAATTGGAIVLVFIVFAVIFFRMRGRQRRQELTATIVREERKRKGAGGVGMLDGEGFGDSVRGRHLPHVEFRGSQIEFHLDLSPDVERTAQEYTERPPTLRSNTQPPFLFPPRTSDSGSAFREEVWPPPRQESVFVDPLLNAPEDDLARIVTDIMGQPDVPTHSISASTSTFTSAAASTSASLAGAAAERSRLNSWSTIYAPTLRSYASSPSLPLSSRSADTRGTDSDDDPPWPPTPDVLPGSSTPPVSYWQRSSVAKSTRREPPQLRPSTGDGVPRAKHWLEQPPQLRPSTGDGSPRVKNWLERTPRRMEPSTGPTRRAASAGH